MERSEELGALFVLAFHVILFIWALCGDPPRPSENPPLYIGLSLILSYVLWAVFDEAKGEKLEVE